MTGADGNIRSVSLTVASKYGIWFNWLNVTGSLSVGPSTSTISSKHLFCIAGYFAMLYSKNVVADAVVSWPWNRDLRFKIKQTFDYNQ